MNRITLRILLYALCLLPAALGADTLFLRDGTKLEGKIVSQSQFQVKVRTAEGDKYVSKSAIKRMTFGSAPEPKPPEPAKETSPPAGVAVDGLPAVPAPTASKAGSEPKKELTPEMLAAIQKRQEEARKRAEEERKRREYEAAVERRRQEEQRRKQVREEYRQERSRYDGAAWRSAVIPGWGQFHRGQQGRAVFFGTTAAASGALWLLAEQNFNAAVAAYNQNADLAVLGANNLALALIGHLGAEEARAEAEVQAGQARIFALVYLGVYFYNLFDVRSDRPAEPSFAPLEPLPPPPERGSFAISLFGDSYAGAAQNGEAGAVRPGMSLSYSFAF